MTALVGKYISDIEKKATASGDNSTVAFNLGFTPVGPTMIDVYLNGLAQTYNTDYTVSGSTVTFATAPANGQEIFISYRFKE